MPVPRAQATVAQTTVFEVPLPGGLEAALAAAGDGLTPDRPQFLAEFIRRTYDTPLSSKDDPRAVALRSLVAALTAAAERSDRSETLPLPLSDRIWIDVVFGGRASPGTLASAILQSRSAALFYCGLLALDDETRAWLAGQRDLIADLASSRAAAFLAAAPGLRIAEGRLVFPGGAPAAPAWQALVGRRAEQPADVVRALVAQADGHLAYFFGTMGQLTAAQVRVALSLESSDGPSRIDGARRLYAVFRRLWNGRTVQQGAFTRPTLDPALLVAELPADDRGRPLVPGTRGLWVAVFGKAGEGAAFSARDDPRATPEWETPADVPWLCERVFSGDPAEQRRRFTMVLFASRRIATAAPVVPDDAIDAIRAVASYPALTNALERIGVTDVSLFARAARRAAALSAIGNADRAGRALAQFQGALALVTRAASRGTLAAASASSLVSSLSAVAVSDRGEYEGRLVSWLSNWMERDAAARRSASRVIESPAQSEEDVFDRAAGPIEQRVLRIMAGADAMGSPVVEWEGTSYRLDLPKAEATRTARALGDGPAPRLSAAVTVAGIADGLAAAPLAREQLGPYVRELAGVAQVLAGAGGDTSAVRGRSSDAAVALQRAADAGDLSAAAGLSPALRWLADELLTRGLMEMAYAAALGPRDGVSISAADAASRHDFGLRQVFDRGAPWRHPAPGADGERRWRVSGSLLGLDVALAEFSLVRLSLRPPPRRPSLNDMDRRGFIQAVALVEPRSLSDGDRDLIVAAIRRGRTRRDAARSASDAIAIGEEIGLSATRRTLLSWAVTHDPRRVGAFLSPVELLWLGLGDAGVEALRPWGAPAGSRLGCLCLQIVDRRPWETFAGRWQPGMIASAFPDLNLRLAEILGELRMPAALLASVLTAATRDLVDTVISRDADDRRGLVEFVQALGSERVEAYLALLTTDGPLVPVGQVSVRDGRGSAPVAPAGVIPR